MGVPIIFVLGLGRSGIFFFALGGHCDNCDSRDGYDMYIDVTAALRNARLHPHHAALSALVM